SGPVDDDHLGKAWQGNYKQRQQFSKHSHLNPRNATTRRILSRQTRCYTRTPRAQPHCLLTSAALPAAIQLKADRATTKESVLSWTGAASKSCRLERQG